MESYHYGLATAKRGTTSPTTGLGTNMVDIGKIYKDTMEMTESDASQTPIYSQQDPNNPVIILNGGTVESVKFSLMDTSVPNLSKWCGGSATTIDGTPRWVKPKIAPNMEDAFEFVTTDGAKVELPRAMISAKRVQKFADNAIWVIEVTLTPLASKIALIGSVMISDAAVVV